MNFNSISHESIRNSSIINIPLWDRSEWKGVLFSTGSIQIVPPLLAPVFAKPICINIFKEWIKNIGSYDKDDVISIKIIKGINKAHPFWYRVIIGSNKIPDTKKDEPIIIIQSSRLHTMEAENDQNLKKFEDALYKSGSYFICPVFMPSPMVKPNLSEQLMIKKNLESISITNACEIKDNDFLAMCGILPTDDPIIPSGKESAPILAAIKRKRENKEF